jgi:large subunit ribosomal protein L9
MEIILKQDVENLGYKDDIVKVKPGYARNFLIPQGYAILASETAKKVHAENLKQRTHKEAKVVEQARKTAAKLAETTFRIGAKAGESGKIFGSVNTIQLADVLEQAGFSVDRKKITIKNEPIKEVGTYQAEVVLHKEISQTITFEVVSE